MLSDTDVIIGQRANVFIIIQALKKRFPSDGRR